MHGDFHTLGKKDDFDVFLVHRAVTKRVTKA